MKPPQSPRFDERGVPKEFGMGKFRKSQKIMRKNKELREIQVPSDKGYSERGVDVGHLETYLPPGPDRKEVENTKSKENPDKEKSHTIHGSKSVQNTPKQPRRANQSRFSRSHSLPHRRVKNFVPFDI